MKEEENEFEDWKIPFNSDEVNNIEPTIAFDEITEWLAENEFQSVVCQVDNYEICVYTNFKDKYDIIEEEESFSLECNGIAVKGIKDLETLKKAIAFAEKL